jgi:hypothetical protein
MLRTTATVVLFVGIVIMLGAAQATADISSPITQDTSLYYHGPSGGWTNWNMGGYTVGGEPVLPFDARTGSTHDNVRPILEAAGIVTDLSAAGVTASSQVVSAQLHLFVNKADGSTVGIDRTLNAYRVTTGPWVEGSSAAGLWTSEPGAADGLNATNGTLAWTTPGGDYDPTLLGSLVVPTAAGPGTELTVTITDAVKYWIDNPGSNYGVLLIQTDADEDANRFFAPHEDTTADGAYKPFITVTTVPEPSALVLIGTGLLGLLAYAWRKRK